MSNPVRISAGDAAQSRILNDDDHGIAGVPDRP